MWMKPSVTDAGGARQEAKPVQDDYIAKLEDELKKRK